MNYTKEICPVCKEKFSENDDIVVCPECGTPHHRVCYQVKNRCGNEELHSSGFRWENKNTGNERQENKVPAEIVFCEKCGIPNIIGQGENLTNCRKCNAPLNFNNKNLNFSFSEQKNIKKSSEFEQTMKFVHSNVLYYLPVFTRFRLTGGKVSFNLMCFIFPPVYFASRKMWGWAVLTAVLSVLFIMPLAVMAVVQLSDGAYVPYFSDSVNSIINSSDFMMRLVEVCNFLDMIMRILCCLFGNRLYYNFVNKSVVKLRVKYGSELNDEIIRSYGGVSVFNILMIITIIMALFYIMLNILKVVLPALL